MGMVCGRKASNTLLNAGFIFQCCRGLHYGSPARINTFCHALALVTLGLVIVVVHLFLCWLSSPSFNFLKHLWTKSSPYITTVLWMLTASPHTHRLRNLNTWSPAGGTSLDGCGSFRSWEPREGNRCLGTCLAALSFHFLSSAFRLPMKCNQQPHAPDSMLPT